MFNPMQMLGMLTQSQNPMGMFQQMVGNNPIANRGLQMGMGKNPQQLQQMAESLARQRGVNLNDFLSRMGFRR
mgnify:CR=1 FL=1